MSKRIILWHKQRRFIDTLIKGETTIEAILKEHGITEKMLERWLCKPAFKRRYNQVNRFLDHRREANLKIGASQGAKRLAEEQVNRKKRPSKRSAVEAVKISRQHQSAPPPKPKRPP